MKRQRRCSWLQACSKDQLYKFITTVAELRSQMLMLSCDASFFKKILIGDCENAKIIFQCDTDFVNRFGRLVHWIEANSRKDGVDEMVRSRPSWKIDFCVPGLKEFLDAAVEIPENTPRQLPRRIRGIHQNLLLGATISSGEEAVPEDMWNKLQDCSKAIRANMRAARIEREDMTKGFDVEGTLGKAFEDLKSVLSTLPEQKLEEEDDTSDITASIFKIERVLIRPVAF